MRIAYGTDTGSVEDDAQIVLVDVPDMIASQGADYINEYIIEEWPKGNLTVQPIVGVTDVLEAVRLAMQEWLPDDPASANVIAGVIETVADAIDNNA